MQCSGERSGQKPSFPFPAARHSRIELKSFFSNGKIVICAIVYAVRTTHAALRLHSAHVHMLYKMLIYVRALLEMNAAKWKIKSNKMHPALIKWSSTARHRSSMFHSGVQYARVHMLLCDVRESSFPFCGCCWCCCEFESQKLMRTHRSATVNRK